MEKKDTAIVILNWNGRQYLEKFLQPAITRSREHARIIVADNGSTDGSAEYLERFLPDIEIIRFETNLGFTGGYNSALKMIEAKYYVLMNTDIEVSDNWLLPVLKLMESDKEIGACQPKILQYHYREMFEYAGAAGGFIDFLGYPFCRGRIFNTLEKDNGQYDKHDNEVFWASGACMFIRADCFHDTGGFDEHFFAHMEEIDLCWRLKRIGKKIVCCTDSLVYHVGGGTLPKTNPRKTYFNFRNSLWVIAKNLPSGKFYWVLLLRIALDNIAALKFFLDGYLRDSFAVLRAHVDFWRKLYTMRKFSRKYGNKEVSKKYLNSIVWDYFVGKKQRYHDLPQNRFS